MSELHVTPAGRAVAQTGLQPATADHLLRYLRERASDLAALLPSPDDAGRPDDLFFAIAHAALDSPEFGQHGYERSRSLPWRIEGLVRNPVAECCAPLLVRSWHSNPHAANAALVALKWIQGRRPSEIEKDHNQLRAGALHEMCRNIAWVLEGASDIVAACTAIHLPDIARPAILRNEPEVIRHLFKFPRVLRRFAWRVSVGVPDELLWMTQLEFPADEAPLDRREILALRDVGIIRPQDAMDGAAELDSRRRTAFQHAQPSPQARANRFRDAAREWKKRQRARVMEWHRERASGCARKELVDAYYTSRGLDFQNNLEQVFGFINITIEKLDQAGVVGAPDYAIKIDDLPVLIMEVKSKEGDSLVAFSDAVKILSTSELHGYPDEFCITLCHPGVDPSVPNLITSCGRLSVVESVDLGEALLRVCEGNLSLQQLHQWLATPGQAVASDLPFAATAAPAGLRGE